MKKAFFFLISIVILSGFFYTAKLSKKAPIEREEGSHPIATFTLENGGCFQIELYPEAAPNSVKQVISLIKEGYYNGLGFNKLMPNYLVQTGDKIGNGSGFPGYFVPSECEENGFTNNLSFETGIVCLSRGAKYNTEGSQFFILLTPRHDLEGQYSAFGKVTKGLELLTALSEYAPSSEAQQEEGWCIKEASVVTFGRVYGEPEVLSLEEVIAMK